MNLFRRLALPIVSFAVLAAIPAVGQEPKKPAVLLIGDSISMGYKPYAAKALAGEADVRIIPENGATTRNGLAKIDKWLGETPWAVIHFNWGLHDLVEGGKAVPLAEYKENLDSLASRLKKTGAVLIFATTTPVPPINARKRTDADVARYNEAGVEIAKKHGIQVNDLYAAAKPNLAEWQQKNDVHFTAAGSAGLGREVAEAIRAALKK